MGLVPTQTVSLSHSFATILILCPLLQWRVFCRRDEDDIVSFLFVARLLHFSLLNSFTILISSFILIISSKSLTYSTFSSNSYQVCLREWNVYIPENIWSFPSCAIVPNQSLHTLFFFYYHYSHVNHLVDQSSQNDHLIESSKKDDQSKTNQFLIGTRFKHLTT